MSKRFRPTARQPGHLRQRGVATLLIALVILVILTVIVLSSTGVALFEQRTATNENRQRLADQVARYSLNLGGEFFKASIVDLASSQLGGWLATSTKRWTTCASVMDSDGIAPDLGGDPHPCMAETDAARRAEMYFYDFGSAGDAVDTLVPYDSLVPAAGKIATAGGTAAFPTEARVRALLCRIDTTLTVTTETAPGSGVFVTNFAPDCRVSPDSTSDNRVSITLVTNAELTDESATASAKETWASFNSIASTSTVPLVASGSVDGTGNVTLVTNPNGAGYGLPVSVWAVRDADVDKTAGGSAASVSSCQLGDFLNKPYRDHGDAPTPESELKTTCATDNNACGCPSPELGNSNFLSGHIPSENCCEREDILDIDCNTGSPNKLPDIQFFPGMGTPKTGTDANGDGDFDDPGDTCVRPDPDPGVAPTVAYDHPDDGSGNAEYQASSKSDDSLFEWVFGVNYESVSLNAGGTGTTLTNCGPSGAENCAIYALTSADQVNAQQVTCAELGAIGSEAVGIYYVTDSPCTMPAQVGSPSSQALVVVTDDARLNNTTFYGMLFVRADNKDAYIRANGNAIVFGSIVVEGSTDINGGLNVVYDPTNTNGPGEKLPEETRLARLSGSWLDGNRGGF